MYEDPSLMVLDKPPGLLTSPEAAFPNEPALMALLHAAIADGKPWAQTRQISHLSCPLRLDTDTSGLLILAKDKTVHSALADAFGTETPIRRHLAIVRGIPSEKIFEINAPLASHPFQPGLSKVDLREGKKSKTRVEVIETFPRHEYSFLQCDLLTQRPCQIPVHLQHIGLTVAGDKNHGGKPLWLSRLKKDYRLKPGREERPLLQRSAVHASEIRLKHPVSHEDMQWTCPLPKDFKTALKYLRLYDQPSGQDSSSPDPSSHFPPVPFD